MKQLLFCLAFSTSISAQTPTTDSLLAKFFQVDFDAMVDSLHMSDTVYVRFLEIYTEYGDLMKDAYENRTSWAALGHVWQWAVRDRDTKMKAILTSEQLYYFKKRQREIEEDARQRKKAALAVEEKKNP